MSDDVQQVTERSGRALARLERECDLDDLVELLADGSAVDSTATDRGRCRPDDARAFWRGYRELFTEVRSAYHNGVVDDEGVGLPEVGNGERSRSWAHVDPAHLPLGA
jgi:hypothetical protein